MDYNKAMKNGMADDLANVVDALPWDELDAFSKGKYDRVSDETYKFVLNEANREVLVKAALKSLKKTEPENATEEGAEKLADMMIRFAKLGLENKGKATK